MKHPIDQQRRIMNYTMEHNFTRKNIFNDKNNKVITNNINKIIYTHQKKSRILKIVLKIVY